MSVTLNDLSVLIEPRIDEIIYPDRLPVKLNSLDISLELRIDDYEYLRPNLKLNSISILIEEVGFINERHIKESI